MKSIRLILIGMFILSVECVSADNVTDVKPMLVLDNYTVSMNVKAAKVGSFIVPGNKSVTLTKDESGFFEIGKTGELSLKTGKVLTASSPMSYVLTVQCGDEEKTFEVVKDEFIKNKVIAHRGGWKHSGASQNTLGSLKHAIDIGCQGAEFDVWLSKDNQVVLNHDNDLDGMIVEKTTLENLQKVKLNNGERVPTLEQYIDLIKTQNKTRLVLEFKSLKNAKTLALVDSAMNIIHRKNAQAWVDYISFDYRALKRVRAYDASAHIAFLEPSVDLDLQKLDGISGIDYHYSHFDKIEKLHERCLMLGLTMNAWTVNTEEWMTRFLDLDIDFITTDEPEMLLKLIDERK